MAWERKHRRMYVLWVNADAVLDLFNGMHASCLFFPVLDSAQDEHGNAVQIPADIEVVDTTHDWYRKQFGFKIAHPSFPMTPDGCMLPSLQFVSYKKMIITPESKSPVETQPDTATVVTGCPLP